jgi:hypothetical protein
VTGTITWRICEFSPKQYRIVTRNGMAKAMPFLVTVKKLRV